MLFLTFLSSLSFAAIATQLVQSAVTPPPCKERSDVTKASYVLPAFQNYPPEAGSPLLSSFAARDGTYAMRYRNFQGGFPYVILDSSNPTTPRVALTWQVDEKETVTKYFTLDAATHCSYTEATHYKQLIGVHYF